MKELFEQLEPAIAPHRETEPPRMFGRKQIAAKATQVINVGVDGKSCAGILAVLEHDDDGELSASKVSIALFDSEGDWDDDEWFRCVFHGYGYAGGLRELRHTYWGEADRAGYIYYVNARLIADAFAILRRWFDLD